MRLGRKFGHSMFLSKPLYNIYISTPVSAPCRTLVRGSQRVQGCRLAPQRSSQAMRKIPYWDLGARDPTKNHPTML